MLVIFYSGICMTCFMGLAMAVSSLGFWVGLSPSALTVLIAAVLAAAITIIFAGKRERGRAAIAVLLTILIAILCLIIAGLFVDTSYDGNSYHKLAIAALADGWNPLYQSITEWPRYDELYFIDTRVDLWVNHYAQGLWQLSASLYDLTGTMEMSKAYTLFSMWGAGAVLFGYLGRKGVRVFPSILIALLLVVNPITLVQLTTFYCDAYLMMSLAALIVGLIMLADTAEGKRRAIILVLIVSAFACCAGTKYTGLAYAGVIIIAFCVVYVIRCAMHAQGFSVKNLIVIAIDFLCMLIFVVSIANYASYVQNFLDYGNPFYPLFG
ncbi:MAG: hypothetical protein LUB61_07780, partial [Eggerthellaceae bacterium]|nr:hypothetical protein [Eggerthellaceae bacterium]